ncbi:Hypothetical protein LUCI_3539 [Lucifera butyrica]|uniref:Hemerythrin-like domain-containing protein n=2 Tax=Lucifera butyrica TaxID=1351585 RepID=A0A498RGM3_9FIRM|nr:Hypothetical protein LUCI_3539 [Lucifera butyrica]
MQEPCGLYQKQETISPTEDLMREHGVLIRIILIYGEIKDRLLAECSYGWGNIFDLTMETAVIAQEFINNYHQKLEETYLFPKFLQEQQYTKLVATLLEQHMTARALTKMIMHCARIRSPFKLCQLMAAYIRMYEPHSAREDTVLFPAFRKLVNPDRFYQLGQKFEEIEEQRFGENGFENIVNCIAQIEEALGIHDLSRFTPDLHLFTCN